MVSTRVDATSPAAKAAIENLFDIAIASGIDLHPELQARERNGQISLHADAPEGEMLVRLPEQLLVPVDAVTWDASDDVLSIVQHEPSATAAQRELIEAHVAVYNATGKICWARNNLPVIALSHDPVATAAVRLLRPSFAREPQMIAEAFIKTRLYQRSLMPVIDLLNHHPRGAPLRVEGGAMTVPVAHAASGTQCFDCYGSRRDLLDLALGYGYVDPAVRFARSLPVSIDIPGFGTVEVWGRRTAAISSLDPPQITMDRDWLSLSHVIFHAGHPDRVVSVLHLAVAAYLARHDDASHDPLGTTRAVVAALAAANIDLLHRAESELSNSTVEAAQVLCAAIRHQCNIVEQVRHKALGAGTSPDCTNPPC